MYDNYGDGWEGTVFALKQNGKIVGLIGDTFTNGGFQQLNINVNGSLETQLVCKEVGLNTNEINFNMYYPGKEYNFLRNKRVLLPNQILYTFCPGFGCRDPVIDINLTLLDTGGDGWEENILGFRQEGKIVGRFSIT